MLTYDIAVNAIADKPAYRIERPASAESLSPDGTVVLMDDGITIRFGPFSSHNIKRRGVERTRREARSLVRNQFDFTTAGSVTPATPQVVLDSSGHYFGISNLGNLLSQLADTIELEEYDDEFLKPSEYAQARVRELLTGANSVKELPSGGFATTSGSGGIRVEWRNGIKALSLAVPASESEAGYIYYDSGEKYGMENSVTPETITKWLNWLYS